MPLRAVDRPPTEYRAKLLRNKLVTMIDETVSTTMICGCVQQPQLGLLILIELLDNASQAVDGCASIQILVGNLLGYLPKSSKEVLDIQQD